MIRFLCCLFFFALPIATDASQDSTRHFAHLEFVTGNSAIKISQDNFIAGHLRNGAGYEARLGLHTKGWFFLGVSYTYYRYWLNNYEFHQQIYTRYRDPGYYTSVDAAPNKRTNNVFSANASYIIHTREFDIEPFARVGVGIELSRRDSGHYTVISKKMNDHYFSTTTAVYKHGGTYEGGGGVRVTTKMADNMYFSLAVGYTFGIMEFALSEKREDYFDNTSVKNTNLSSPFHAWQVRAGFQFRLPQ